ncbi:hypothetical protein ACH36K_06410 [Clostridium sp. MB05]|uniref:hypothetical protein n=1 Tax=Clostridium sp. MB05 TaxID=3376682 RepID=UPI003981C6A8
MKSKKSKKAKKCNKEYVTSNCKENSKVEVENKDKDEFNNNNNTPNENIEALLSQLDILDLPRDTNYIIILSILANNINNNDNNNENNNNNANNNNNNANNNNTPNENMEVLLSQLDILNLSRDTIYIILLSLLASNINNNNNNTPNANIEALLSQLDMLGLSRDTIYIILLVILSNNSTPKETLLSQLCTINLSIDTIHIISLAVLLYIYYLYSLRAKVLDGLCNTNESKEFIDTENFPKMINLLLLYSTGVFLDINYKALQKAILENRCNEDKSPVITAWKVFLASLLRFISIAINMDNVDM